MVESACLDEPRRVDEEVSEGGPCEGVVRHSQSPVRVGVEVTDVPSARSHPDPYGRTIAGRHGGNHPAAGTVDYAPELHQVPAFCDAEVGVIRLSPLPTSARCDLQPTRMGYGRVLAECASTTEYLIDGSSDTSTNPVANPFTGPRDAKVGYKVLAFCPDHPQAAKIKENADQASMQARQGPDVPQGL